MGNSWVGMDEALAKIADMAVKANSAAREVVVAAAAEVERRAKANFSGAHPAGQPHVGGSLPNIVTGTLRRSIYTDPVRPTGLGSYVERVGPTTAYARRIELGYPGGGAGRGHQATRPYPYFRPAVESSRARFEALSLAAWMRVRG